MPIVTLSEGEVSELHVGLKGTMNALFLKDLGAKAAHERLRGLEAEVEEIEGKLAAAPRDVPDVHPNVAELYRRKVERRSLALDQPDERDEAAQALRALIDRIALEPGPKPGEVLATLYGDLESILAWTADQGRRYGLSG